MKGESKRAEHDKLPEKAHNQMGFLYDNHHNREAEFVTENLPFVFCKTLELR
ncbi:hypothetical protein HVMH_0233 [Hydrogenovibrio marinus]|nr:hypothetical protein HVMH_0233 [Hydrogenovibrio marinus]